MPQTALPAAPRALYRWQLDALVAWLRCGRRGVVEAVTGSGKTDLAIAAVVDAHRRGLFVLVVVPSRVLLEQWVTRLGDAMAGCRIGRLGDSGRDTPEGCDVLVATRHSAAALKPVPPTDAGGLLVADECHGMGGRVLRRALLPQYQERLGLTATLERADDAVDDVLLPYFGGLCFRYDFAAAIADGVCARPRVAFVGVALTVQERQEYVATEAQLVAARTHLRRVRDLPLEPFGAFLAAVAHLADNDGGPDGRAARDYLDAFGKRRQIVAASSGKYEVLGGFASAIRRAEGALLFTETVRAANHAINRLDPHVSIEIITGSTARRFRREILDDLRARRLDAVAAPRVLDEGIDVPDANLGIVVSASRTRRQMIQRMGRILRRKRAGVGARFVILYAKDTMEDPTVRVDRDGFLEEIEAISEATATFDATTELAPLGAFLDAAGPPVVVEPHRLGPFRGATLTPADAGPVERWADGLAPSLRTGDTLAWAQATGRAELDPAAERELGRVLEPEVLYAHLNYLQWDRRGALHSQAQGPAPLPTDVEADPAARPYLEADTLDLPVVATPKAVPRRLSTGERPLVLTAAGSSWSMRCTGCGEQSTPVRFRWQAFDQTVDCRCA